MRITTQLLKKAAYGPLHEVEYLDLSNEELVAIERLSPCRQLQALILYNNSIDAIHNIDCCRQLWHIDLTGNKVKSLHGLSRFPVLGMLSVGFNNLDWTEVKSLSHIRLISLTLIGNPKLDKDPHYREHVVDILPHLWVLDARMITAEERKRVTKFFSKSQSSDHPVRKKASESVFVPTSLKNLMVTGVFGEKSTHLMSRFPVNYAHNVEMDKRRLCYLAYTLQQDMELQAKHAAMAHSSAARSPITHTPPPSLPNLESLLEQREREMEQCNMLLLLLLAYLEYSLPVDVMRATLETAKLTNIGDANCVEILNLPVDMIHHCTSILLNAAAINRQENKEGGLYDKLFQSLCYTQERVYRKLLSQKAKRPKRSPRKPSQLEEAKQSQLRCLLASEVVHLMCLVPLFFESLEGHPGLMRMVVTATKNPNVADVIGGLAWKVQAKGGDVWEVYHDIASYLLQTTSENVMGNKRGRRRSPRKTMAPSSAKSGIHRTSSQPLLPSSQPPHPKVPLTSGTRALSAGAVTRRLRKRGVAHRGLPHASAGLKEPDLGDVVLISEQQIARIVALPEPRVAVLQITNEASVTNPPDAYFYSDTQDLVWDKKLNCWVKDSTSRLSPSPSPSPSPDHRSMPTLHSYSSATSVLDVEGSSSTLRMATPEPSQYHGGGGFPVTSSIGGGGGGGGGHARPHSQMSFSDDLQTIPSQEELEIDYGTTAAAGSMRVDIASSAVSSSLYDNTSKETGGGDADLSSAHDHQLGRGENTDTKAAGSGAGPEPLTLSDVGGFRVPTPQLHLSETWDSNKSLPSATSTTHSGSKRPHSCHHSEMQRQSSKIEPYMSPVAWEVSTTSPGMTSTAYVAPPTAPSPGPSIKSLSTLSLKSTLGSQTYVHTRPPSQGAESAEMGYPPVTYSAWTTAKPNASNTRHTALTSSRLMTKRRPNIPPVARKSDSFSSSSSSSRRWPAGQSHHPSSTGNAVILQQKPLQAAQQQGRQKSSNHMAAYSAHAQRSVGRYQYQQPRASTPTRTRRLGDLGNIYIDGTSIG